MLEIKGESLGSLLVIGRDEGMVLYSPPFNSTDRKACYEIVLQRHVNDPVNTCFSLFRSTVQQEAEDRFNAFVHRLPVFVSIVKEVMS